MLRKSKVAELAQEIFIRRAGNIDAGVPLAKANPRAVDNLVDDCFRMAETFLLEERARRGTETTENPT